MLAVALSLLWGRRPAAGQDLALERLRERYARGDIGDEEFDDRRDRLERTAGGSTPG